MPEPRHLQLDEYATKYDTVRMRREDGILEMVLHTGDRPIQWNLQAHHELTMAFLDVANDPDTRVVILTGTAGAFSEPFPTEGWQPAGTAEEWTEVNWYGRRLHQHMFEIEVPLIAAVNGPAYRHSEIPLLCDIVLADTSAVFGDPAHFNAGLTPGDGIGIVYSMLLGPNRARYLMLTGQLLDAVQAEKWGLVNEVLEPDALLPRAWELARSLARRQPMLLRHTRLIMTHELRRRLGEFVGYGLSLEALASVDAVAKDLQTASG
jgi:enoyl-CoA hydratase/carnithine racemase